MRMDGRRTSTNVDDRRGMSGGKAVGMGLGGLIIIGLITWALGGNPLSVIQEMGADGGGLLTGGGAETSQNYQPTEQEEALAEFSKQILASTEDVWTKVFREQLNAEYEPPKMVLFTSSVQTGCGGATASVGPFYCSADKALYIDLSFFSVMKQKLGADGEFAYAYVIAHEVGHHVENLLGILGQVHQKMQSSNQTTANQWSVRLELQADYLAGVWGHHESKMFNSIDNQDIRNAIDCSKVIGDDYLQKKSQGYTVPDAFTHGTSAQREKWLTKGLNSGNISQRTLNEIYNIPYSQL
ncbi:MAG: neutral zinc metallopeptidase [Bacteroidales bacterium]|nr:neutral zinc metallopeptidase [Bacteroidales bacterium]